MGPASGNVLGDAGSVTRAGLADVRVRLSVLVRGAPASSAAELAKAPRRTILGTSLVLELSVVLTLAGLLTQWTDPASGPAAGSRS